MLVTGSSNGRAGWSRVAPEFGGRLRANGGIAMDTNIAPLGAAEIAQLADASASYATGQVYGAAGGSGQP